MKKAQNTPKPKDCVGKKPNTAKTEKKLSYPQRLREKIKNLEAEIRKKNEDIDEWKAEYISIERNSKELERQLESLYLANKDLSERLEDTYDLMEYVMSVVNRRWIKTAGEKWIIKDIQRRLSDYPTHLTHLKQVD